MLIVVRVAHNHNGSFVCFSVCECERMAALAGLCLLSPSDDQICLGTSGTFVHLDRTRN